VNTIKKRILLAEDEVINLLYMKSILERENYCVFGAHNGEEALLIAMENRLNIIVADIGLPGIDGVELISRIRTETQNHKTPIIVATANLFESDHVRFIDAGADAVLVKPFDERDFLELISRNLMQF